MHLLPRETDKVLLHSVGFLAQKRLARGVRLNLTEATALIASVLQELVRDGGWSVAQLMEAGESLPYHRAGERRGALAAQGQAWTGPYMLS